MTKDEDLRRVFGVIADITADCSKNCFDINVLLYNSAQAIAGAICPENEQFVVEDLGEEGVYTIILAKPADSRRHSLGQVGHLHEPIPKTALLEAIDNRQIVVVQDAFTDSRVEYMREHVYNKGIKSLVILPICVADDVRWLIIIDKGEHCHQGFSESEVKYFQDFAMLVSKAAYQVLIQTRMQSESDSLATFNTMQGLRDQVMNPFIAMMGLVHRIVKEAGNGPEIIRLWNRAADDAKRIESELNLLLSFTNLLAENGDHNQKFSVAEMVERIFGEPIEGLSAEVKINPGRDQATVVNNERILHKVLTQVREYIAQNGKDHYEVSLHSQNGTVKMAFKSAGFHPFKQGIDIKLTLIETLVKKMHGKFRLENMKAELEVPKKLLI